VPYLKLATIEDPAIGAIALFALNRHLREAMPLEVTLRGYGTPSLIDATQLRHSSLKAVNTKEQPDRVAPTALKGVDTTPDRVRATLAPASWNVIRFARAR